MNQKAEEKGITVCPNCETPDIFFSLAHKCTECDTPLKDKPKTKTLQFSIEVLLEFTLKYDEMMPPEAKNIFSQLAKAILYKLQTLNTVDNSKLIQFQHLCNLIPTLGSNSFGGAIDGKKMSIQLLETATDVMTVGKSLGAVLLTLQYIREYQVANEFVIESSPSKPIQKEINQPRSSSSKKNSGCLVTLLSIFFISVFIIISIYLL